MVLQLTQEPYSLTPSSSIHHHPTWYLILQETVQRMNENIRTADESNWESLPNFAKIRTLCKENAVPPNMLEDLVKNCVSNVLFVLMNLLQTMNSLKSRLEEASLEHMRFLSLEIKNRLKLLPDDPVQINSPQNGVKDPVVALSEPHSPRASPGVRIIESDDSEADEDVLSLNVQANRNMPNRLRPVIIDGQNVAYMYKVNQFHANAMLYAVRYFLARGHSHITVIVPRRCARLKVVQTLYNANLLRYVPKRVIQGSEVQEAYDDLCIIETAMQVDGVIVSNDQYRRETEKSPEFRDFVNRRLLMFYFSGKNLIIPQFVHGPNRSTLDEILRFPTPAEVELARNSPVPKSTHMDVLETHLDTDKHLIQQPRKKKKRQKNSPKPTGAHRNLCLN